MRETRRALAVVLLLLGMLWVIAAVAEGSVQFGAPAPAPTPTATPSSADVPWTYPISQEILADPLDVLVLANREHRLASDYPPNDELHKMVKVTLPKTSGSEMTLRKTMHDALAVMFEAAEAEGIKLYVESAYRSYQSQKSIYGNRIARLGYDDLVSQPEGASEHQTGLTADILNWAWRDRAMNTGFAKTKEAQWMAANCARFGFILRYPEGKKEITGINYEPWHLRYVGVEVAEYMTANSLTLEEFTTEVLIAEADYLLRQQQSETVYVTEPSFSF
ncbi:MAG: M15 family metallopeptidase [Oscillospiraceae bacterium]|jgi:D-alanyl-D-alanine carboxypeptidase|nr:M15 family metallopeptidase [Oscillospiraceae bacterium]